MLSPESVFNLIRQSGIDLFTGVPDSLLKNFCAYVTDNTEDEQHIITANEGNAIALASGHYLGSGSPALVYMQNSGIGNAVNPITSLADSEVYGIPMLLMVGWRGEPGFKDEPQHLKQGRVMTDLLDALEIPWHKVGKDTQNGEDIISNAIKQAIEFKTPVALLISKGTFETYKLKQTEVTTFSMNRESAIKTIVQSLQDTDLVVSTTGMASRELYEIRAENAQGHNNDFLTVGSMGHTASIALGLALAQPTRKVLCIDGDGSLLMHMGALAIVGKSSAENLIHVTINNGAHDSVGGQPTLGFEIDLSKIADGAGYKSVCSIDTQEELQAALATARESAGPSFIEVRVNKGSRENLGRPKTSPIENKNALMSQLGIKVS